MGEEWPHRRRRAGGFQLPSEGSADLSIVADLLGWNAYVIDFHLRHKSGGNPDAAFEALKQAITMKYRRAFRARWHHVPTKRPVYLSASRTRHYAARAIRRLRRAMGQGM